MSMPTLLAVAHGTHDPAGAATVRALLARVRVLRPWIRVAEAYAEIATPSLEQSAREIDGPVVVVPLMLARGYHALIDIPGRVRELCRDTTTARPLGPQDLLGVALLDRLGEAWSMDAVVLGAAGSADPAGVADVRAAARLLARMIGRPVSYGFVAAGEPRLADAVAEARRRGAGQVAVASYLLAPGFFHSRMTLAGADFVSPPIGAHDAAARLVLRRFDEARTLLGTTRTAITVG